MTKIKCLKPGARLKTIDATRATVAPPIKRERGRPWMRRREQALKRDCYLCQACAKRGLITPAREVDHITPLFKGGRDNLENLQALCVDCHREKSREEEKERRQ